MEGSSVNRPNQTVSRDNEAGVEIQKSSKRTRSFVLKQMLEELRVVKKESMDAIEDIEAYQVKKEPVVEEEQQFGLAGNVLDREEIPGGGKKSKGKQQPAVTSGVHGSKTYHAAVYRASFQRRDKSNAGSDNQNGKDVAVAMSNDEGRIRREGKRKGCQPGMAVTGERRTRQKKDLVATKDARNGGAETCLEKVKGKAKLVGNSVEKASMRQNQKAKDKVSGRSVNRANFGRKSTLSSMVVKEQFWTRVVDNPVKLANNVLHIPRSVVRECISGKIPRITLIDRNNAVPYYCEMIKREDTGDRYLLGGWSDFCKDNKLQKGDTLRFCIRYPPVDSISVTIERGKAE
ncbi:uncharacterized protein LOC131624316 isoform X2 [Vicia villosa]|uniref:uncharacterized protein LOC131624316 isoform X2 n=1 Tax=Vicia villosa TaxID=3911 RepID=UPI00273C28F9|nr:uncharacterized protein LOC131624316 isoform X2 [Vicia villosa]